MIQSNMEHSILARFFCLLLLFITNGCSAATTMNNALSSNTHFWTPVLTLTAGSAFNIDTQASRDFPAQNGVLSFYHYDGEHTNQTIALFGGFIGIEWFIHSPWSMQTGLSYYQPSQAFHAKGRVTQGVDETSQNQYTYQFSVENHQLLFENKWLYSRSKYHPYFSAGVGSAWNTMQDYHVNIQPVFTSFSPQFSNKTTASFSYALGFGMDVDVLKQIRLGIGYRFADLGQTSSGQGVIDTVASSDVLSQSHIYTQEVNVQITYIVG